MFTEKLGLKKADCNAENQNVIYQSQYNMDKGKRPDSYTSFAAPYEGKGLTVLTFAHVSKLILKDKTAIGVEVSRFGQKLHYFAKNEVILSAGAINSPQILMLSGIGPKEELKKHEIPIILGMLLCPA